MTPLLRLLDTTFASLRVRNYRLYWIGQIISVSGSWMQRLAQSWLVLHLTGSGLDLGIVSALQFLPVLLLGAYGGVVADRTDKRRLLIGTQTSMGFLAAVLGALTLSGAVRLWMVYLLALVLGLVTALDTPSRQAFVVEMVGRDRVSNAVSLNSAVFTSARIVGPAIGGIVITLIGTGWCFVLNAASFGAVVFALAAMDPARLHRVPGRRLSGQLREGLRHVWSRPDLRTPLFLLAVTGTFALNWSVVLPLLAKQTFHGNAGTYGLLFAVLGLGSLAGALFTASRRPDDRLLLTALGLCGLLMLACAAAPVLGVELVALIPTGVAAVAFQTSANSLLQLRADPHLRGRVMAIYSVVFVGTTPIGAPIVGWVSSVQGPRAGLALGSAAVLAALLVVLAARGRRLVRRRPAAALRGEAEPGTRTTI